MINQEDIPNLIKIRSLIAPGFVMSRIKLCVTQPRTIKDRILIRLGHTILTFKIAMVHLLADVFCVDFFTCFCHHFIFSHFYQIDQEGVFCIYSRKIKSNYGTQELLNLERFLIKLIFYRKYFTKFYNIHFYVNKVNLYNG